MWAWIPGFLAAGFALKGLDSAQASMSGAYLGRDLAWRSLLGFIAGALAPLAFGGVLDLFQQAKPAIAWGMAFATLGLGGIIASYCAVRLKSNPS